VRLQGKIAVIAGGGGFIGRAISLRLAREGATIAIADMDEQAARRVVQNAQAGSGGGIALGLDVTDATSIERMAASVLAAYGRIDVLVNVFGTNHAPTELVELPDSEWERVLQVNLTGVFRCSRVVGRVMREQRSGKIINIASINGVTPPLLSAAYNASKAGVLSLTRTMAYELAPFSVQVNAVNPGPVDTPLAGRVYQKRAETMGMTALAYYERLRTDAPTRRLTAVEDVASAVAFLASPDADNIVGVGLDVCGGLLVVPSSLAPA
jgi:NAD(P)-dependent dehydrogenase (short-subunit alcohol dehydrogenase family)